MLSPSQFGVPNTRFRYYCLARKCSQFKYYVDNILEEFPSMKTIENTNNYSSLVKDYLDDPSDDFTRFLLPESLLVKRAQVLDIAHPDSIRTMCFTKAYTHYTEGTGSVYCPMSKEQIQAAFEYTTTTDNTAEALKKLSSLQLRYFTPTEVARLMCFPVDNGEKHALDDVGRFTFPKVTTNRQKYRLLGNSINVYVVSNLIRILFA